MYHTPQRLGPRVHWIGWLLLVAGGCCWAQLAAARTEPGPASTGPAPEPPPATHQRNVNPGPIEPSIVNEGRAALRRGVAWLQGKQSPDGYWSNREFPALTGLALWALVNDGAADREAIQKAVDFLRSCVQPDGGIYQLPTETRKGGGLSNYNTAICMVALHAAGDPELVPIIQRARQFVAQSQHFGDDLYYGGMGYDADTGRPYADLSNSYLAYEAMRLTRNVEDLRRDGEQLASLDWDAAIQFIQRVQNLPEYNDQPWASDDPAERGGFAYKPDASMAGSYTNAEGVVRLRSYGSMTYAGLLSFIYADVNRQDPRVQSAYDWACRHWSLEENPGMGRQGLYYYYHVLAKALAVFGEDTLNLADQSRLDWRTELVKKLVNLQRIDPDSGTGYWVNEEGRWWEADPVLTTSYALLALEMALNQ
jgi:squalene-hopene/tetraprenyl-beta-curcumene cyclase